MEEYAGLNVSVYFMNGAEATDIYSKASSGQFQRQQTLWNKLPAGYLDGK